jgi:hypothetical protein
MEILLGLVTGVLGFIVVYCLLGGLYTINQNERADPRGSLRANLANATVRCLSDLPLHDMLESRHMMSHTVGEEVSPKAQEWGVSVGFDLHS